MNFVKTDQTCSNVYLIDENLCAGNTLEVINYNTNSLSSSLIDLQRYSNQWTNLYTTITEYSAKFITASTNLVSFSATWLDTAHTIQTSRSNWAKNITFFYPQLMDITDWLALTNIQQKVKIHDWLFANFPPINFDGQTAEVVVLLYGKKDFNINFDTSYQENCIPNGGGVTFGCNECPRPSWGCNHHGGLAGVKNCDNVFDYCSGVSTGVKSAKYSCSGQGSKALRIVFNKNLTDRMMSRNVTLKYTATSTDWTFIV